MGKEESMKRHPAGKARDVVNNPAHYTQFPVEVIELTEHLDFLTGNIVKYVVRAPFKGSQLEDLKKAEWYLKRLIHKVECDVTERLQNEMSTNGYTEGKNK